MSDQTKPKAETEAPTKADRFRKLASKRTNKILNELRILANCANPASYEYTPAQVEQILGALDTGIAQVRQAFTRPTGESRSEFQVS